jgi:hypothetical protein
LRREKKSWEEQNASLTKEVVKSVATAKFHEIPSLAKEDSRKSVPPTKCYGIPSTGELRELMPVAESESEDMFQTEPESKIEEDDDEDYQPPNKKTPLVNKISPYATRLSARKSVDKSE